MPDSAKRKILESDCDRSDHPMLHEETTVPDVNDLIASSLVLEGLEIWRERANRNSAEARPVFISDVENLRSLHFDWNAAQSEMNLLDPIELTAEYTQVMMGFLLFNPRPTRLAMVGLGGGSLPKLCYHILPEADITVIELNPKVIRLRDEFFVPPDDHRFRVVCEDGADFVARAGVALDVLLIDGFDVYGQPPQLCSPEFYDRCYERLAPGGLMVVNLWGGGPLNRGYMARIRQSFSGNISCIPAERGFNRVVIAAKGAELALSQAQIAEAVACFGQRHAAFLPAIGKRIRRQLDRRM